MREGGPRPRHRGTRTLGAALAILTLPLAALGFVLYGLPYQLPRLVTKRLRGEGDVASTYKLGVGLVVFPVWILALVVLALVLLPSPWELVFAALALASPFAALPWVDRLDALTARARVLAPREVEGERVAALVARRASLMAALSAARGRVDHELAGATA
jgi:membrane protein implicated in regulation of membrane protease activity